MIGPTTHTRPGQGVTREFKKLHETLAAQVNHEACLNVTWPKIHSSSPQRRARSSLPAELAFLMSGIVGTKKAAAALDAQSGQLRDKLEEWFWGTCIARSASRRLVVKDATAQARPHSLE